MQKPPLAEGQRDESSVLESTHDGVRTLTLNRPQALNSFTTPMLALLTDAVSRAATDPSIRCLVITGAGRAFCAGQDLSDPGVAFDGSPGAAPKDLGAHIDSAYGSLLQRLHAMPVPTVAMVQGVAAGAGASIALGCDLVLAARSASFIQAFSKIALVPDTGGTWLLPRLVGRANALAMAMLGDKVSAEDAARMGLIWRCLDDAALRDEVGQVAQRLSRMPTAALVRSRALIDASLGLDWTQAIAAEVHAQRELGQAHDYQEGVRAFMDKRAPQFKDR